MPGLKGVVGTQLAGAIGRTEADQLKIDRTVARLCGGSVWSKAECAEHTRAVRAAYGATTTP